MQARDRICDAASDLFDRLGFEATSTAAICKAAGVSNGSFFHAFPNKESLGAALYLEGIGVFSCVPWEADRTIKQGFSRPIIPEVSNPEGTSPP
jgi:AcrR family transcriptional regulator